MRNSIFTLHDLSRCSCHRATLVAKIEQKTRSLKFISQPREDRSRENYPFRFNYTFTAFIFYSLYGLTRDDHLYYIKLVFRPPSITIDYLMPLDACILLFTNCIAKPWTSYLYNKFHQKTCWFKGSNSLGMVFNKIIIHSHVKWMIYVYIYLFIYITLHLKGIRYLWKWHKHRRFWIIF